MACGPIVFFFLLKNDHGRWFQFSDHLHQSFRVPDKMLRGQYRPSTPSYAQSKLGDSFHNDGGK